MIVEELLEVSACQHRRDQTMTDPSRCWTMINAADSYGWTSYYALELVLSCDSAESLATPSRLRLPRPPLCAS